MLEDFEFNPKAAGMGLLGGALSVFVMKNVKTSIFINLISFVATSIVCYFVFQGIAKR